MDEPETVAVVCPYCQEVVGRAPVGWLQAVRHHTVGHTFVTARPEAVRFA